MANPIHSDRVRWRDPVINAGKVGVFDGCQWSIEAKNVVLVGPAGDQSQVAKKE